MGAHALKEVIGTGRRMEIWDTAVFYHMVHAVVLLVVGLTPKVSKPATICFVAGIILFSGSLYLLALTDISWLGAITPLGGLFLLLGWACLAGRLGMSRKPELVDEPAPLPGSSESEAP